MENASGTQFINYALIIAPIIISIVAIWVSVSTANKQNKIAMFELRYKCLSQIRAIIAFDKKVYKCDDPILIWSLFDCFWDTNISDNIQFDEKVIKTKCCMKSIERDILQAKYLFRNQPKTDLEKLVSKFQKYMIATLFDDDYIQLREDLHTLCIAFSEGDYSALEKETTLQRSTSKNFQCLLKIFRKNSSE